MCWFLHNVDFVDLVIECLNSVVSSDSFNLLIGTIHKLSRLEAR